LNVQHGHASKQVLDDSRLPAKTDAVQGIAWLPRLLPKARAKLRGELPPSLMFCCGGDRAFCKQHNLLPAEFLSMVARHEGDQPVIEWVARRSAGK
jgi:hypothetical protein